MIFLMSQCNKKNMFSSESLMVMVETEERRTLGHNPVKSPFVSYCENNNSLALGLDAARTSPAVINHSGAALAPRES